ncbi:aldo/keto reductase [Treponema berlinense]|uniref:aldo/keto reductase n=1 Tax=Treponema berlinense TaxID=225004 RepID=UPI002356B9A6|nr:aldo/keto reductase [Treponema berlinense]
MSASLAKTNSVSKLQGNLRRFVVIPGSKNVDHIKDNLNIMDFKLTADEMAKIASLDKGERYYHRTDEQLLQFAAWKPEFEKA